MVLKLRPELKKNIYMCIYIYIYIDIDIDIYTYMFTLKLSKTALLSAASTFTIWTENNRM